MTDSIQYGRHIQDHLSEIRGDNLSVLIASKNEAEHELYGHMCRTERRNSGIINTDKARAMSIDNLSAANVFFLY